MIKQLIVGLAAMSSILCLGAANAFGISTAEQSRLAKDHQVISTMVKHLNPRQVEVILYVCSRQYVCDCFASAGNPKTQDLMRMLGDRYPSTKDLVTSACKKPTG